jgi:co-chaperonin GroES (HSP10)
MFVEPITYHDEWHGYKTMENIGIAKYVNADMQKQGINSGDKIAFKSFSNYEFEIFNTKLWMMRNRRITAKLS